MSEETEKKDFLSTIIDGVSDFIDQTVNKIQEVYDSIFGKTTEEGEEPEGIMKIISDIRKNVRETLGWEEGFDIKKTVTRIRNRIREILGMELLPEDEE